MNMNTQDTAAPALVRVDEETKLGPAMLALTSSKMRTFVEILVGTGCSQTQAAKGAYPGVSGNTARSLGHKMAHDPRVQAALLEVSQKLIRSHVPMALATVIEIARNKDAAPRDRLKAATVLLDRGGLNAVSQHHVTVTHQTDAEKDREIIALANELGLDDAAKAKLLGKAVVVTDVEFVDVPVDGVAPRGPTGRPITNPDRGAEIRAGERARHHETPEERKARQVAARAERSRLAKETFAAAAKARAEAEGSVVIDDLADII